jgi:hypothetical protein
MSSTRQYFLSGKDHALEVALSVPQKMVSASSEPLLPSSSRKAGNLPSFVRLHLQIIVDYTTNRSLADLQLVG